MKIVEEEVCSLSCSRCCPHLAICKQIFGPVLAVGRFDTEAEAIALANATSYGLGAGLHSSMLDEVVYVSRH